MVPGCFVSHGLHSAQVPAAHDCSLLNIFITSCLSWLEQSPLIVISSEGNGKNTRNPLFGQIRLKGPGLPGLPENFIIYLTNCPHAKLFRLFPIPSEVREEDEEGGAEVAVEEGDGDDGLVEEDEDEGGLVEEDDGDDDEAIVGDEEEVGPAACIFIIEEDPII